MPKINNHPIAHAVEPLRTMARDTAREHALSFIVSVTATLEAHAWDFNKAFPHPDSLRTGRIQYHIALNTMQEARQLVTRIGEVSYMPRAPYTVAMDSEGVARFVKMREDMAEASYEAFAAKLIGKVGTCDTAELGGGYVWSNSVVTVTKGATVERWHTQMIANRSSLGKWFNQWPTRLQKPAKPRRKAG